MTVDDVLRAAKVHWWLVLASLVLTLGCAGLATIPRVPQYAARVTFFVTTPSQGVVESYHGGLFARNRVTSYAHLIKDGLPEVVASSRGVDLTPAQVRSRITSRSVPDSVLIEATVTDTSRARSERIVNLLATEFIFLVERLETPPGQSFSTVKIEVASAPRVERVLVPPGMLRNLALVALLGLVLGVVAAVVRELIEATVKTPKALRQVASSPVLGVVPFDRTARRAPLVVEGSVTRRRARRGGEARGDAFRHLRTELQFADVGAPTKLIMITSSGPGEGKSTTAVNLAVAFAEAGRRVALVETDRRRPRVAEYLGLDGTRGLSDVLNGEIPVDAALQQWGHNKLCVLPAGTVPPNRGVRVGPGRMAALLQQLREAFDVVIVDAPSVRPRADAVAAVADGVVLVVRAGSTRKARVRMAVANLRASHSRLIGCVLNMYPSKVGGYHYWGGQYRSEQAEPYGIEATHPVSATALRKTEARASVSDHTFGATGGRHRLGALRGSGRRQRPPTDRFIGRVGQSTMSR